MPRHPVWEASFKASIYLVIYLLGGSARPSSVRAGVASHGPKQEDDLRVHGTAIEAQFMTLIERRGPTRPVLEISKGLCTAV
ncbi:uncharacterized protein BO88DRAFT_477822 [Aspergillus vadensis CBS 113365]|uniref:Secreted protein n=1 Tax=Aspergillus vadensis (strain CBS 113365 / IMI 142717 / IBT 24658) TaxID=1448311 RepID=A0A319ASF0_ASPVC|nr:hypothetical protein BO88DRAFT_477822 [Aspergillus vadensis CBS 113365]PYH63219.1 hypothetical protein BO88DRAFT_477822 [Aspergillus vadensis CBS 113365]